MEIEIQKVGTKEQDEYLESIKKGEEFWTTKEILKNLLIRIFPDCIILIDQPITIGKDLFKLDKNSKCISCKDFEFKEGLIQYPTFQIINHSKEFFLIFSYIDAESLINPEKCFQEIESHCQYKACGWKLLEFPYFIQASKENLLFLLNSQTKLFKDNKKYLNNLINLEYEINFPNGFIHPNQLSIGHFCAPALDYVRHVLDILPFNTTLEVFESCFYKAKNKNIPHRIFNPLFGEIDSFELIIPKFEDLLTELKIPKKELENIRDGIGVNHIEYLHYVNFILNLEKMFFYKQKYRDYINYALDFLNEDFEFFRKLLFHATLIQKKYLSNFE